ncbi:MAG TPA: class I SAM-dependent methyltransferase [Vicinamibacterales bacterium]|jgi:methyltransferase (TIGR00027 family)|nr:class I SAM-dependent methyltransferase [Vicinamibacterales bacterium]
MPDESLIRNISDTALWVAEYRARETERGDAVFRDPLARRLAGARGAQIVGAMPARVNPEWAYVARTVLFDRFVLEEVARGADVVVNLAAGLDTRPYRLALPASLTWIEVDLPDLVAYKEEALGGERPVCTLERVAFDLSDVAARRTFFTGVDRRATRTLILSEGLLIYFTPDDVAALARDLAACPTFQGWVFDIASPGLLAMLEKQIGDRLRAAGAPFRFAPPEGPAFFEAYGWHPASVESVLKTAARLRRLPLFLRLIAMLPDEKPPRKRPWSAVCRLARARA